jgi:spermidine synthase
MSALISSAWLKTMLGFLFFLSGFTGLLYQLVWLRLAFASFGIVTAVLSVLVAVFMLGLSLGSWIGGRMIDPLTHRTQRSAIEFYGLSEWLIGLGAFAVPYLFEYSERMLVGVGEANSLNYMIGSAAFLSLSLLPWCFFMGTTFPFMMAFIKQIDEANADSFSFLYACNVLGAMVGTVVTAFILIELLGFRLTLWVAGSVNFLIATISIAIAWQRPKLISSSQAQSRIVLIKTDQAPWQRKLILFTTGFASLAMEVVWTRAYMPVLGTQVYTFALLLFVYLLATRMGSVLYRKQLTNASPCSVTQLLALLSVAAFLPLVLNDPQITSAALGLPNGLLIIIVMLSIFPICALLGYLTPYLVDADAVGNPAKAGQAYAVNIVGCILGPLAASYLLLPHLGAKNSMIVLALPFLVLFISQSYALTKARQWALVSVSGVLLTSSLFYHLTYEDPVGANSNSYVVRRDHTATVTSFGRGMDKQLTVNGVGITHLTPITKFMAHLPLGFLPERPQSALVICFGMGTTYRSLLTWDIQVTGAELVPSVKDAFGYYFADADEILRNPKGQIVIDDGRRFLQRTQKKFDVITIDAPPPVEAAGSSLLYTEEFYQSVKEHLTTNGLLQQWFPGGEKNILQAVARSLTNQFPHVRAFPSIEGSGVHFLASVKPFATPTPDEIARRMPIKTKNDLLEWRDDKNLVGYFEQLLKQEIPIGELVNADPDVRITDDRPYNEYYLLRRTLGKAD